VAKYEMGKTYHEGNDNLNEAQFSSTSPGKTGASDRTFGKSRLGSGSKTFRGRPQIQGPKTQVREVTQASSGVTGGQWRRKK
jgi:hypothetical protein